MGSADHPPKAQPATALRPDDPTAVPIGATLEANGDIVILICGAAISAGDIVLAATATTAPCWYSVLARKRAVEWKYCQDETRSARKGSALMGHIQLGRLPRTKRWHEVIELIGGSASSAAVASATLDAAERDMDRAGSDPGVLHSFYLLTQLPDAARSELRRGDP